VIPHARKHIAERRQRSVQGSGDDIERYLRQTVPSGRPNPYSYFNASSKSNRVARRAGTQAATRTIAKASKKQPPIRSACSSKPI